MNIWFGLEVDSPAKALRSAPAQKLPPSPHKTATAADASFSNSRKASAYMSATPDFPVIGDWL